MIKTSGSTPFSLLTHLECSRSGVLHDSESPIGLSEAGAPLLARYDLERVSAQLRPEELRDRPPTIWRYHEMLPVRSPESVVTLGEGMTPLLPLPTYGARIGLGRLCMKDEGLSPTGAFKARGAAVGVSRARELGVAGVAMPTNGNAGAAWAMYAARAGLQALIAMPADSPAIAQKECVAAGAELHLVDGLIGDAGRLITRALVTRPGFQDVSSLKEPYRVEGKKTMGYEIAEQLGWRLPDVILYPTGGGVGLIGIYKAIREMQALGWIDDRLPRLVAVQAEGCAPIVDAFCRGLDESVPPPHPQTIAFGINVPKSRGDFLVLDALRATGGTAVAVSDEAVLAEVSAIASAEGALVCPEGAACLAAARQLRESGWLAQDDLALVLNTASGLKYPGTIEVDVPTLPADGAIPPWSTDRPRSIS